MTDILVKGEICREAQKKSFTSKLKTQIALPSEPAEEIYAIETINLGGPQRWLSGSRCLLTSLPM